MKKKSPFKAYITYIYLNFETMNINLTIRHFNSTLFLLLISGVLSFGQNNNIEIKNILVNTNHSFSFQSISNPFLQTPIASNGFQIFNYSGQVEPTPSTHGTLLYTRNNTLRNFIYTPQSGFIGSDTFVIKYNNTSNVTVFKKYIINIKANFVFANEDYFYVLGGSTPAPILLDVLANDSSTNSIKTLNTISLINNGSATILNNKILFTPNSNYYGVANLKYTVCNGSGICSNTNVNINVARTPLPLNDTTLLTTTKNKAINFVIPQGFSVTNNPTLGAIVAVGNSWQYTPNSGVYGNDQLLLSQSINGIIYNHLVKVMILYTPDVNQYAIDDYAYTAINTPTTISVLANDFGPIIVDLVTPPTDGSASVSVSNGIVSFIPTNGFVGVSKFTYKVRRAYNASGPTISETANVNVLVSNRKPELVEYTLTTTSGTPVVLNYVVPISNFNFNIVNAPSNGTLNYYSGYSTHTINGQTITGNNLSIYTPSTGATADVFDLSYCVASDCKNVKVNVVITTSTNSGNTCVGTDCVWAGDANADGKVDMLDLLQLGYCMGESGTNRPNATMNWEGQFAPNWGINNCTNIDSKYMDTDGNGIINSADTTSISTHYGNYHNLTPEASPFGNSLPLYFVPIGSPTPGDLLEFKVMLGNTNVPAIDVYGLKFSINYDPNVAVPNSEYLYFHTNSWMAFNSPLISMSKKPVAGTMDGAMTRTNNQTAAGMGEIGRFGIVIDDDIIFRKNKNFNLKVNIHDAVIGNGLGQFEGLENSTVTVPITFKENENNPISNEEVVMFPNPAREYVNFYANGGANISKITISNIIGKTMEVFNIDNQRSASISTGQLNTGTYMVTLETDKGTVTKKLIINK